MSSGTFQILDAAVPAQAVQWIALWQTWPQREVYAHPYYVRLSLEPHQRALCAILESAAGGVLYPFIWRDLTVEPCWDESLPPLADIVTPYGYGGPFAWNVTDPAALAALFWDEFGAWAARENLVSEFIRFSLFDETLLPYPGTKEQRLINVVRDLDLDNEALWMDMEHKVRKNVKRARQMGVQVIQDPSGERLDDFLRIYQHTMDRRSARQFYYFPRAYFEQLQRNLPGQFMYFHSLNDDQVIASELVLVSAENVYSFLGGSDSEAMEYRPNDVLKYEIIQWAKTQGKKRFVLGGGYQGEDGIFRYKLSFAPGGQRPFSVGWRILNQFYYDQLVACCQRLPGGAALSGSFFPLYRG
jgi:hypothetical protein